MAIPPPQSHAWPADRAVLLVHGVGNARPGDYDLLVTQIKTILGDRAEGCAIYTFYYDQVNDWFAAKTQAAVGVAALVGAIRATLDATTLGSATADFVGDVIWPVLIAEAREAVRTALLRQVRQMVTDGERGGIRPRDQHLSIIAHSLGCFHTFEALHVAARDRAGGLTPSTHGVVFDNVVLMASPVQLIRTVAGSLGALVPERATLRCISDATLAMPAERTVVGHDVPAVRRTVSVTGDLDPVGGYFLRRRYAYMDLDRFAWTLRLPPNVPPPTRETHVDEQRLLDILDEDGLAEVLRRALRELAPPRLTPENPHAWSGYVGRHESELRQWLV